MADHESGRTSISSVDARVARLESAQADTDAKIGLISLEQTHLRELMNSRFSNLETLIGQQGSELKSFITRIDTLILQGTASSGDLSSTPAGRQVNERLVKLETEVDKMQSFRDEWKGVNTMLKIISGGSILGLVTGLLAVGKVFGWF